MSEQASHPNPDHLLPMEQLVNADAQGRAHRPNGEMMSNYEREQIEAHQEQISEGLGGHETAELKQATDAADAEKAAEADMLQAHRTIAMKSVNDAVAAGEITEFSAGPDFIKATGLSHEDVQALGFNGFGELKSAASVYQAEQQTADAAALAEAEQSYDKTKRQEAADTHAKQWRAEIDEAKAARDQKEIDRKEANLDAVVEHGQAVLARDKAEKAVEDRVEQLSYAEMLKRGGSVGQKRNPAQAAAVELAATERAKQEGFDMNNLPEIPAAPVLVEAPGPEPYAVPVNIEAEKRQAELAQLLRAHDAKVLGAQVNTPEQEPIVGTETEPVVEGEEESDLEYLFADAESETTVTLAIKPEGIRKRMSKLFEKVSTKYVLARNAVARRTELFLKNGNEFGEVDPKRVRAAVVGTVLGATALVLATKFAVEFNNDGSEPQLAASADIDTDGTEQEISKLPATEEAPVISVNQKLEAGGNVWNESVEYADKLGYSLDMNNAQDVQIADAIKDEVLRINNITDPTHLPVGYELTMPHPAEIEEILKKYKK